MLRYRNIKINELLDFIHSDEFQKMKHIPICEQRALAQAHNPYSLPEDIVLYLVYEEYKMVAYLGALPDSMLINNNLMHVAWLSSMWVDENYRRQGLAENLLKAAHKDWNGQLLISNFIPRSKKVFDRSGLFEHFQSIQGLRGYLRFNLSEILVNKNPKLKKLKALLSAMDGFLNLFNAFRLSFWLFKAPEIQVDYLREVDTGMDEYIRSHSNGHLFPKSAAHFNWIINYPWITESSAPTHDSVRYQFSSIDNPFKQFIIRFSDKKSKVVAFMMITHRGSHLTTEFLYAEKDSIYAVRNYVFSYLKKQSIKTFTTYDPMLIKAIKKTRHPFILTHNLIFESIITHELGKIVNKNEGYQVYGDGDTAFT